MKKGGKSMLTWLLSKAGEIMLFVGIMTMIIGGYKVMVTAVKGFTNMASDRITDAFIQKQMQILYT